MKLNSSKLRNVTSTILGGALRLGKLACRIPFLRAIPQLRPMDYACPIIEELPAPTSRRNVMPPHGPPRLRLRKRRRLRVRSSQIPNRKS